MLVGHSTGGTYAMTYAARYPEQVAGLVLPDSASPEQFTRMPAYPGQYAVLRRAYALIPTLSSLGLGQVPATSPPAGRRRREGQRDHRHPPRPARGRPPRSGVGPRDHRGRLLGPHPRAARHQLTQPGVDRVRTAEQQPGPGA